MKVYTKGGDKGTTALIGGERVSKSDLRVEAYGSVDELMAFMALLGDYMREDEALVEYVEDVNIHLAKLMSGASLLAVGEGAQGKIAPISAEHISWIEQRIDTMQDSVPAITKFTLPGGNKIASMSHVCRTVCRRAERAALRANEQVQIDPSVLVMLNRLSDYLYLLGRVLTAHYEVDEVLWIP